jgi:outer membrane protein OmpA-like peptidoglycan-associated protein
MGRIGCAVLFALYASATPAAADPTQIGAFFGPRLYSNDSRLGYIEDAPEHPMLDNAIAFGARIAKPFFPFFVPEFELAMASTQTNPLVYMGMDIPSVDVFWIEPRIQMRFEILPERRVMPFVVVGGGAPIALSSGRQTLDSGITGEGYVGGGIRFDLNRFVARIDARVTMLPGAERYVAAEFDFGFGLEFHIGERKARPGTEVIPPAVVDRDNDGIADATDACPTREEDADGFEDTDGCPDIDNDGDLVLDIADRCSTVAESYNGFEDDDGCPDTLPPEVDALKGTVEGLIYAEGETAVRESAKPNLEKIAKLMQAFPSIKVQLIGHTDDREANQFATAPKEGEPAPDLAQLAIDLSRARADAVRQALVGVGVPATRVEIDGKGGEEPVSENDKPRGRLANRRVEIRLYVPPRRTTAPVAPSPSSVAPL